MTHTPHPNHKILCAIRHQINITKDYRKKGNSNTDDTKRDSCETELQFLRRALISSGHANQVVKIGNTYHRNEQAQIQALKILYEQTRNKELMLLLGEKTM